MIPVLLIDSKFPHPKRSKAKEWDRADKYSLQSWMPAIFKGVSSLPVFSSLIVLLTLSMIFAGTGCLWSQTPERRYYSLVQPASSRVKHQHHPYDLWVREVEIASVYDRIPIVFRYSPTELRYHSMDRWADRPQSMIGQHIVQVMRGSGLFRNVSDRLGTRPPDFVLETNVLAIEQMDGGDVWYAHLAVTYRLIRFGENEVLWEYSFSERRPLNDRDVSLTVRAISEIFDEQIRTVLGQLNDLLSGAPPDELSVVSGDPPAKPYEDPYKLVEKDSERVGPDPKHDPSVEPSDSEPDKAQEITGYAGVLAPEPVDWRKSPQFSSDPTIVHTGKGAIFLPAIGGDPDREPSVEVYKDGEVAYRGSMGRRIPVDPGKYVVHFGSGTLARRMNRVVEVEEDEVVIIEPDWGALDISVVDDKFIPWRGSYEIYERSRTEYVGLGYGADEEQGERTLVWILRPGIYKIVQTGASFRTRMNFATVQIPAGDFISYVLVIDPATNDFLGAGISDIEDEGLLGMDEGWSLHSSIGGDFHWNSRTGYDTDVGSELALTFYLDNLARFRLDPHLWTTRLEIEEGHRLIGRIASDGRRDSLLRGEFEPVTDRMYLNSLYIYELLSWAGPYARFGGESSIFHRYRTPGSEQEISIYDKDGDITETYSPGELERIRTARSFSPLEFKEGVGVNFRLMHTANLDLDLRVGFGARQYLSMGQLLINEDRSEENKLVLEEASNSFLVGPETTVVAAARITRYVQGATEFDALTPVGGRDRTRFTWRNSVSLRLSTYASLIYTHNLDYNPNVGRDEPLLSDQGIRLRFSYIIF